MFSLFVNKFLWFDCQEGGLRRAKYRRWRRGAIFLSSAVVLGLLASDVGAVSSFSGAAVAYAASGSSTETVPATSAIALAGLGSVPSGSEFSGASLPVDSGLPVVTGDAITVSASGTVDPEYSEFPTDADGIDPGETSETNISAYGGISGIADDTFSDDSGRELFLVGVFTGSSAPVASAPSTLDFTNAERFLELAPQLDQQFYIGDGEVGGVSRQFVVPSGASHLYLGFDDAPDEQGPPSAYADNTGSLSVSLSESSGLSVPAGELIGSDDPSAKNICECSVGGPISLSSGAQWLSRTDLSIPGRMPLVLSESYSSSLASTPGPFGYGWTWSYGLSLTNGDGSPLSASPTSVQFNEETGASDVFEPSGSGWAHASWVDATLTHNSDGTWTVVRDADETFQFNADGQLTSESDLNGDTVTISYPSSTSIVITGPAGRTLTATLNDADPPEITSVSDPASPARTVSFGYDSSGNLTSVTDVDGGVTSYGYDSDHRLVEERSPDFYSAGALPAAPTSCSASPPADITSTVYDTSGRAICQWDPDGDETTFSWVADGLGDGLVSQATVTDPSGDVTVYNYTGGMLMSKTEGYGTSSAATWSYAYDPTSAGLATTIDPDGDLTTATYDADGNELSSTNALGQTTTWTYNSYNEMTSVTPPATYGSAGTATTTYAYDQSAYSSGGAGNLTTLSTPILSANGTSEGNQVTHYVHGDSAHPGDVTSMIDPDGNTWTYTYDAYGDEISEIAPATSDNSDSSGSYQNVTKWAYDTDTGWVTAELSGRYVLTHPSATTCAPPAAGCTTYTYNNMGQLLSTTLGNGDTTTSTYDADGNQVTSTDGDGNTTTYTYDPDGQETSTTLANGTVTSTSYLADGSVASTTNGDGDTTSYTYDPLGHLVTSTDPDGRTTTYTYDPDGDLLAEGAPGVTGCSPTSTADGCTVYSYNAANQLTSIAYHDPGTPDVTDETYDADGRRTSMTDGTGTTTWAYDSLGGLTSTTNGSGATVSYGYDAEGNNTSITYPGDTGTVTHDFDAEGREDSITDWLGNTTTYTYDAAGDLTSQTTPTTGTPVVDTYSYDPAGVVTGITVAQGATTDASFSYTDDTNNQVTGITSSGVPADTNTYGYNQLNQLTTTDGATNDTYDAAGNPTEIASTYQGFDPASQLCWGTTTAPTGSPTCSSPPSGATTYSYDNRGNRTETVSTSATTFDSYDQANQLTSSKTVPASTSTYAASVLASDPTAFWPLDDSSGTTAVDSSGNDLDGTYVNSPTLDTPGALANNSSGSVTLNGSDQYVSAPSGFSMFGDSSGFTIEGWVKPTAANSWARLVDFGNGESSDNVLVTVGGATGNDLGLGVYDGSSGGNFIATDVITENVWQYVAATFVPNGSGGGTATLYVNGQNVGSEVMPYAPASVTRTDNYIGKSNWDNPYFQGSIQDVAIYPTALPATTILDHYTIGAYDLQPTSTYAYNGDGQRMSANFAGSSIVQNFVYDDTATSPEIIDGAADYIYGPNGLPLEEITGSTVLWYHHDRLGSTRLLTNDTGQVIGTATYTPYGATAATTGTTTPLGYTGAYTDPDGLIYLNNRYYDPRTAQFLSVDPLVAETGEPYSYANDDPINEADPLGLCSGWLGCITHYAAEGAEYGAIAATTVAIGATVVATDGADAPLAVEAEGGLLSSLSVTSAEDAATASSVARTASAVSTGFSGLQSVAQCTGIAAHEATAANCGADIGSTLLGGAGLQIGSAAGLTGPANLIFANSLSLLGDGFSDGPWGYNQVGQSTSQPTPCEQKQPISSLQLLLGGGLP